MESKESKLRGRAKRRSGPYPLGEFPDDLAYEIGKRIVHHVAVGNQDISGDELAGIFADCIGGVHRGKPLGVADVEWQNCAWSVKTVKDKHPFRQARIRIISGRNSPAYSSGIKDPFVDIEATGRAVLDVWNARVNEALHVYNDLRVLAVIRNMEKLEFTMFEYEASRFIPGEYSWTVNQANNFNACNEKQEHCFTWQPHGSQFTIIHWVPVSAYRFRITKRPTLVKREQILSMVGYDPTWIERVN